MASYAKCWSVTCVTCGSVSFSWLASWHPCVTYLLHYSPTLSLADFSTSFFTTAPKFILPLHQRIDIPLQSQPLRTMATMHLEKDGDSTNVLTVATPSMAGKLPPFPRIPREVRDEIYYYALLHPRSGQSSLALWNCHS